MSTVLDLFSGAGGWSLACSRLGLEEIGIEWDPRTCETRRAAGFVTVEDDVAGVRPDDYAGVDGLIASPPCQPFSTAGKGGGIDDPRGQLVYQPMRFARRIQPRWIACEEVPGVLPIWKGFAFELRRAGYTTWTGILAAEEYGVPQTRRRAFLLAVHGNHPVHPPAATHSRYRTRYSRDQPGVRPWRSMADGISRGFVDRPSFTVTTRGNAWGGTSSRLTIADAQKTGRWKGDTGNLTVAEFGTLQSFPEDYPWQGPLSSKLAQIGNAIPPDLASVALSAIAAPQTRHLAA